MCKMEDYVFTRKYSAIYVRWCIGYLARPAQLAFLKKAKAALANEKSFIFVQDNVGPTRTELG